MSGKIIRFMMAALLTLVITLNAAVVFAPISIQAVNSPAALAMEHSTTGS
jgi:hypothetical protein